VNTRQLNAVSSEHGGGAMAAPAASQGDAADSVPATDMRFCAIDDPSCEACQ